MPPSLPVLASGAAVASDELPAIESIDLTQYDDDDDGDDDRDGAGEAMRNEIKALCANKSRDGMSIELLRQLEPYFKRIRTKAVWNTLLAQFTEHSASYAEVREKKFIEQALTNAMTTHSGSNIF